MTILARLRVASDHLGLETIDEMVPCLRGPLLIAEFVVAKERSRNISVMEDIPNDLSQLALAGYQIVVLNSNITC